MGFLRLQRTDGTGPVFIRPCMVTMVTAGPLGARIHLSCGCAVDALEGPEKVARDLADILDAAFRQDAEGMYATMAEMEQRANREPWQGDGEEGDAA